MMERKAPMSMEQERQVALAAMVDKAVELDRQIKKLQANQKVFVSRLQAVGLMELENTNRRYIAYEGNNGAAVITWRTKFEVDNMPELKELLGSVLDGKVTREEVVKYKLNSRIQNALGILYTGDYAHNDIDDVLYALGLTSEQRELARKKLKGDYSKDLELLRTMGVAEPNIEEELDAIHEEINYQLVRKFVDLDTIDLDRLRRALSVEDVVAFELQCRVKEEG